MPFTEVVAEIPLGQSGLSGSKNTSALAPDELILAENITYENGVIGKEGGALRLNLNSVAGGGIICAGHDWFPTPTTQRTIIATTSGYLIKDIGMATFSHVLTTGMTNTNPIKFVEGGQEAILSDRKLFIFNGTNPVKVLQGDLNTTHDIALPAADWTGTNHPSCGVIHEGRLFVALGHRIYWSTGSNHEDFTSTSTGQIPINTGVGQKIVGLYSFKGVLLIFKYPRGIFLLDTSQYDFTSQSYPHVMVLNENIGISTPHAVVQIDDDLMFMSSTGDIHILSGIDNFNVTGANVSQLHFMNSFIRDNLNLRLLDHVKGVFYAQKREVIFAVPQSNATYNTARLTVDLNIPSNPRFRWSPRDVCEALWLKRDSLGIHRPMIGDHQGYVWSIDQESRSKIYPGDHIRWGDNLHLGEVYLGHSTFAEDAYLGAFQTPHMDFGQVDPSLAPKNKLGHELEIVAEPREGYTLYCDVFWDGQYRHTITFPLDPTGARFGTAVFGTSVFGSSTTVSIRRRRLIGTGRRLSLKFYNQEELGDFAVGRCFVRFKASTERVSNRTS